ncbi:MAG: hypothetical protein ACLTYN_12495 [Dysosmobacter welbionis]
MKRILIVEDEPELQELLCAYLQDAGYAAAVAGDGAAALDLFRAQSLTWSCWTSCCRKSTASGSARRSDASPRCPF